MNSERKELLMRHVDIEVETLRVTLPYSTNEGQNTSPDKDCSMYYIKSFDALRERLYSINGITRVSRLELNMSFEVQIDSGTDSSMVIRAIESTISAHMETVDIAVLHAKKRNGAIINENNQVDELVMELSCLAGNMEGRGEITIENWDELIEAINDIINTYYETDHRCSCISHLAARMLFSRFTKSK